MTSENTRLESKQESAGATLFFILVLLYLMHNCVPAVGYYMPSIVYLGIFGILFLLSLSAFYRKLAYTILGFFCVNLIDILMSVDSISSMAMQGYGMLQGYLYGLLAVMLITRYSPKHSRRMMFAFLLMIVVTCVSTIIGNERYTQPSRLLATLSNDDVLFQRYTKENIGGFTMAYGIVFLVPLIVYMIRKRRIPLVLAIGMLVLFGMTLLSMEYGMAVMLFIASLMLLFMPKLTTRKIIFFLIAGVLILLLFGNAIATLIDIISESIERVTLSERFQAVADMLRGQDTLSAQAAQNRSFLYAQSWETFWNSSLLGAWGDESLGEIGGHSFVLDTMGQYGLLGIVAISVLFGSMYKVMLAPYKKLECYPYFLWIYLMNIVMLVLNPVQHADICLFIVPIFGYGFGILEQSDTTKHTMKA